VSIGHRHKRIGPKFRFPPIFLAAEVAKLGSQEKMSYEQSLKYYRDLNNVIDTAFDEGKAEGLAEGEAKGKAEGLAEGEAKGLVRAKRQLAKGMKDQGLEVAVIAKVTGLSAQDIAKL